MPYTTRVRRIPESFIFEHLAVFTGMELWDPDLPCTFIHSFASLEYTLTR